MSFRARLLVTSLLTLAVGLGALLVAGNVLLALRVRTEASNELKARAETEVAALAVSPAGVRVRTTVNDAVLDKRAWVFSGRRLVERPADLPKELDRLAVRLGRGGRVREQEGPDDDVRLRAQPVYAVKGGPPVGAVVVAFSVEPLERLQKEVLLGSLVISGLVLLAGGLAIRSAVQGALRPVVVMTERAAAWGAHDLDGRFDLGEARDELTGLAATLDGLLARIAASRRHEQRFAAEIAHELRTPLARLRGRAELALRAGGSGAGGGERDAALELVVAQADELTRTIDALLAAARQELDPAAGAVDLAALAREVAGVTVEQAGPVPLAEGEADVVRRALAPLVENARAHARGEVRLQLTAGDGRVRLTVRDDGPGPPPDLGDRIFEPGVRGADEPADGAGLGLPLARRLARSCGGDVRLGDGPGGCFVLELPAVGPGAPRAHAA